MFYKVANINRPLFQLPPSALERRESSSVYVNPEDRERFDWEAAIEPCRNDIEWKFKTNDRQQSQNRSSARDIAIKDYRINPHGYGLFILQTRTIGGRNKAIGGDYWRAYLTGAASQNGYVHDLNNGMYEIWFSKLKPGRYKLHLVLEYSLCDGLRDPPLGWFERGTVHGNFQEEGVLGYVDDFLMEKAMPISFNVGLNGSTAKKEVLVQDGKNPSTTETEQLKCSKSKLQKCFTFKDREYNCDFVWDGQGKWVMQNGYKWVADSPIENPVDYSSKEKLETLWFLGDSLTYRMWDSSFSRVLCKQAFKRCKKTYTWVYELGKQGESKKPINAGLKFNQTRFFQPLHSILNSSDMKSNRSVVLINFGLHLLKSLNFSEYQEILEKFVTILDQYKRKENNAGIPTFIWKTTTLTHKENTKRWNITHMRFLTNPRVALFNAYTNSRLCTAGIPILDIYPISASFHEGTRDHVHYHNFVFEPAEDALADYIWKKVNL